MAIVYADRVKVRSRSTGTGEFELENSVDGLQSFDVIGDGNQTYYGIVDAAGNWEIGLGTYEIDSTNRKLYRDSVVSSSNSNLLVNFPVGGKNVYTTIPSSLVAPLTGGELDPVFTGSSLITADIKGSVFADDSTMLIDGTNVKINLDGTVKGDIIPDQDIAYDIGSATYKFRDIYLSGSTINLGSAQITATGSTINLPVVETFDQGTGLGVAQLTANTDLEINAGNRVKITGGIPFRFASVSASEQLAIGAQEGDVIYNTTTSRLQMYQGSAWKDVNGNVEATAGTSNFNDVVIAGDLTVNGTLIGSAQGNHTGTLAGDVVGSVFADDSAVMVDALNYAMFSDTLSLTPLNAEPENPVNGMIAVADGTGWDPASNAKNTLVAYLGGAWVTVAAAA